MASLLGDDANCDKKLNNSPNPNRHSVNLDTWSHIHSNLLHQWLVDLGQEKKLLIIDVRSVNDYRKLHIKDAINIPYSKIFHKRLMKDQVRSLI
jgi:3-mercaptopyruvate sulfurtransferase SseA